MFFFVLCGQVQILKKIRIKTREILYKDQSSTDNKKKIVREEIGRHNCRSYWNRDEQQHKTTDQFHQHRDRRGR